MSSKDLSINIPFKNRYVVMSMMSCIMDCYAIMILTVPIIFPVIQAMQFDPLPDDLTPRLQEALAALPAERRIAFELIDVYGLSLEDAALIEDVAVGTIKSRRHRAREALRETLQPEWEA